MNTTPEPQTETRSSHAHVLIGDGHLRGRHDELEQFRTLLARIERDRIEELSILGDLFELWLAIDDAMPRWQHETLNDLYTLRDRGVKLRYAIGNKDYFVSQWNRKHGLFDSVIDEPERVESPQGLLYLAHGDRVNQRDRQYQLWRKISRSTPATALALALPPSWLGKLGQWMAVKMETTNSNHKIGFPEEELRARASELPPGKAIQFYGHFHVHHDLSIGDKRVITLPFLAEENAGLIVDHAGIRRYP